MHLVILEAVMAVPLESSSVFCTHPLLIVMLDVSASPLQVSLSSYSLTVISLSVHSCMLDE